VFQTIMSFRLDNTLISSAFASRRWAVAAVLASLVVLGTVGQPAAQSKPDAVTGTWGVEQADGTTKCEGTTVMVFHQGRYFRVLPNVGSTGGNNQLILTKSTYRLRGDRLIVAAGLSFTNPLPRQTFVFQRVGGRALILQGKERVTFKPCPPIDPAGLDAVVK
jgi:hypothetical protein